jgi:hypothetical protein
MSLHFLGKLLILLQSITHLPDIMDALLSHSKTFSSPLVTIPLLGVAVDVTTRLHGVEDVNSTSVSAELKVIDDRAYQTAFDDLSDRDPYLILELGVDVSDACAIAHYGSIFSIIFSPLALA